MATSGGQDPGIRQTLPLPRPLVLSGSVSIEASGVGDPWKIAEIALIEPLLRLDRVVVLADASRIRKWLENRGASAMSERSAKRS